MLWSRKERATATARVCAALPPPITCRHACFLPGNPEEGFPTLRIIAFFAPETNTSYFKSVSISAPHRQLSFAGAGAGARRASQFHRREALLLAAEGGGAFSVTFRGMINLFPFTASTKDHTHPKNWYANIYIYINLRAV